VGGSRVGSSDGSGVRGVVEIFESFDHRVGISGGGTRSRALANPITAVGGATGAVLLVHALKIACVRQILGEGRAWIKAIRCGRSAKGILVLHIHIGKRRGLGGFKGGEAIHLGHSGGEVAIDGKLITIR